MMCNALRIVLLTTLIAAPLFSLAQERTVSDNVRDEAALIATLEGDADWAEKQAACRSLRRIGTEQSIPALAKLLESEEMSHMARYALEVMPYPEAGEALRDALDTTDGLQRAGVAASLGARRDEKAVPQLIPLIDHDNLDIAKAATAALGRIASQQAVGALMNAQGKVPQHYALSVSEALLAAAQTLVDKGNSQQAASIYETLLASENPQFVRLGAFRGIVNARPGDAPERVLAALEGDDALMRDMAGQLVAETSGAEATKAYANALPSLEPEVQVVLLRGLGDRGDAAAHEAVLNAAKSADESVKLAALQALAPLGEAEDVSMLAGLLESNDENVAGAARDTLANMINEGTDDAIIAALPNVKPAVRASLLTLLAGRGSDEAVAVASNHLDDDSAEVRTASLEIIGRLGAADEAALLVDALMSARDPEVFTSASRALGALSERERDAVMNPLISAKDDAEGDTKIAILRALGRAATPMALEAMVEAMGDEALNDEAVKILGNWPAPEAAPHLLELARSEDAALKDTGLRGYVRLAGQEESTEKKVEMLNAATALATSPQEKWIVLSAWGQVPTQKSLDALLPQLNDEDVQNEAAAAVIAVATELGKDESAREGARQALQAVVDTVKDEAIRSRAEEALGKLQ